MADVAETGRTLLSNEEIERNVIGHLAEAQANQQDVCFTYELPDDVEPGHLSRYAEIWGQVLRIGANEEDGRWMEVTVQKHRHIQPLLVLEHQLYFNPYINEAVCQSTKDLPLPEEPIRFSLADVISIGYFV